jgi:multiple sugar transport system permease protein
MTAMTSARPRYLLQRFLAGGTTHLLLMGGSAIFLFPLLWMVTTSLKPSNEIFSVPPTIIPSVFKWSNYSEAFQIVPFGRHYLNTVFVVTICVIGNVFTAALCAYGFARLRARGRDVIFALFLATMMLPPQVTMIPIFILFQKLGWINTYWPLIIPAFLGGGAFNVFLLRQFFMSIPRDLEEAGLIDGCSRFMIFWRIFLPLSRPALLTVTIFAFMWHWNDFISPLIYLHDQDKYTLALSLNLFKGMYITRTPWGPLMAASTMMILPVIALFFALQRYFVEGIAMTGIKG